MAATIAVITSTMQAREGVSAGRAGGPSLLDDASSSPLHKIRPPRACIEVVVERGDLETERAGSFWLAASRVCLQAGDHCVITNCSYGGTNRACRTLFTDMGMEFDFIDFTELVRALCRPRHL